jgi:hypothetical protein
MTNEFNVIGERKDDDRHLLVRGEDGRHYDYSLDNEQVAPVEPDERWQIDSEPVDEGEHEGRESGSPLPETEGEMPIG